MFAFVKIVYIAFVTIIATLASAVVGVKLYNRSRMEVLSATPAQQLTELGQIVSAIQRDYAQLVTRVNRHVPPQYPEAMLMANTINSCTKAHRAVINLLANVNYLAPEADDEVDEAAEASPP